MKIIKKKGGKFRIEHNKTLFWIIIFLIIILGFLVYSIAKNNKETDTDDLAECSADSDCAAVCGCHPESCIPEKQRGECPNVFCSQVCSGPLDCGAGSCGCVEGKCQVVPN
ncbi:MAG: hypothetical protein Q8N63_02460 [Nanoarchaeota archaeon]|nr:hypothetical protein [Nanoarchaeota archaeon]